MQFANHNGRLTLISSDHLESLIEGIGSLSHTFIGVHVDQPAADRTPHTKEGG